MSERLIQIIGEPKKEISENFFVQISWLIVRYTCKIVI